MSNVAKSTDRAREAVASKDRAITRLRDRLAKEEHVCVETEAEIAGALVYREHLANHPLLRQLDAGEDLTGTPAAPVEVLSVPAPRVAHRTPKE